MNQIERLSDLFPRLFGLRLARKQETTENLSLNFLDKAKKRISILLGEENSSFFRYNKRVEKALERAKKRGVTIEVIQGPGQKKETSNILKSLQQRGLLTLWQHENPPSKSFVIVDSEHILLTVSPYGDDEAPTVGTFNTFFLALNRQIQFNRLRTEAIPVNSGTNS